MSNRHNLRLNDWPHRDHEDDNRAPRYRIVVAQLESARVVAYESPYGKDQHPAHRWYCWVEVRGYNHMNEEIYVESTSPETIRTVLWRAFSIGMGLNEPCARRDEWVDVSKIKEILLHETVAKAAQNLAEEEA